MKKSSDLRPENPIFSAIKKTIVPSNTATVHPLEILSGNPSSDITERRLIKRSLIDGSPNSLPLTKQIEKEKSPANFNRGYKQFLSKLLKNALLIFPPSNKLRKFLDKLMNHWIYETFMLFVIFLSSLILVIWNPLEDPNSPSQVVLSSLDLAVTVIYGVDFVMNIIAYGFFWGPDTYLRRSRWNLLDFGVFIFSLVGVIIPRDQIKVNSMKVFRVVRILKVGQKHPGIKVAIQAFIAALPNILRLVAFSFVFIIGFALYGMSYLKGLYYSCSGFEKEFAEKHIRTKIDCFDYGGDWVRNDMHFDTIISAANVLFQVATSEGWLVEMHKAVDATYYDHQPEVNHNVYWVLYYLSYFFVGNYLVMNMFIAVIVETYLDQKNKASKFNLLTEEQKEWALIKTSIYKMNPKKNVICLKI